MAENTTEPNLGVLLWRRLNHYIDPQIIGLLIAQALLVAYIGSQEGDKFFLTRNLLNIGLSVSIIGLVAVAQTLVMLSGGLDVSIGSAVGLAGVIAALAIRDFNKIPILSSLNDSAEFIAATAVVVGILFGALLGLINGLLITYGKLNAVIATLGTLSVYKGIAFVITDGRAVGVQNKAFNSIGSNQVLGSIPLPLIIMLVVSLLVFILLRYTDIGRNIYALGGNPIAARLSGISINRYKMGIYVLCGAIAGVAAIILTARTNSGQPASGSQGLEFQAITAAVLGGTALSGGKGSILGTLLAVIIIGTLNNGMILLGVQTFWQEVARGMLLIVATLIQIWRTRE